VKFVYSRDVTSHLPLAAISCARWRPTAPKRAGMAATGASGDSATR
jgi:hypothetical protein